MTMPGRTRYRFVDFAAASQPGFRNHVVPVDEVPALVASHHATECYATVFRFSDDLLLYVGEHRVNGRPSIAGYDGPVWAPFLPLDVDGEPTVRGLDEALAVTRRIHLLLVERWQAPEPAVHLYFSGAKGFHVLVDVRAFGGVRPSGGLPRVFGRLRLEILRALPDAARPHVDLAIGDTVRLLRLANTRHAGSGLYKVPLEAAELHARPADDIRRLAVRPRPDAGTRAAGLVPTRAVAAAAPLQDMLARVRAAVRRGRGPHPYNLGPPPPDPRQALCPARLAMWESHVPPGNRNNVAIRLASALRLAGHDHDQSLALLRRWNAERRIGLDDGEIRGVVRSAYARPYPYAYGCHDEVIREYCPYVGRLLECADHRAWRGGP